MKLPFCEEATRHAAREDWDQLHPVWRFLLRFHLLHCIPCRRYLRQLKMLAQSVRESWRDAIPSEKIDSLKTRLISRLIP